TASAGTAALAANERGSVGIGLALSPEPGRGRGGRDHHTGDADSLASTRVQGLPALEVAVQRRPPEDPQGDPRSDLEDEPDQLAVGYAADSWRAAQARH